MLFGAGFALLEAPDPVTSLGLIISIFFHSDLYKIKYIKVKNKPENISVFIITIM